MDPSFRYAFNKNEYDFEPPRRQGRQEKLFILEIKLGVLGALAVNLFLLWTLSI
jgi:hypothetical protein